MVANLPPYQQNSVIESGNGKFVGEWRVGGLLSAFTEALCDCQCRLTRLRHRRAVADETKLKRSETISEGSKKQGAGL